jgi:hypothetical protein
MLAGLLSSQQLESHSSDLRNPLSIQRSNEML